MRRRFPFLAALALLPLQAADPLSLPQAVTLALQKHPSLAAAGANIESAAARIQQAQSGLKPKVSYTESVAGSNNPVFVFGSLLSQRQFTEQNFNIDKLNRPDFLANFQSVVALDQPIYDGGQTRANTRTAQIGKSIAGENERLARMSVMASVVRSYLGTVLAAESLKAAEEAVRSAQADLTRAETVRNAGMSTDADVLSIKVHLAGAQEQRIRRQADLTVARAALNEAMGIALDTGHELTTPLASVTDATAELPALEAEALKLRPDARQAAYGVEVAQSQLNAARGARLPQISARAAFEADRQRFVTRAGANWYFGGSLRWNIFDGDAAKARIAEAASQTKAATAQRDQLQQGVRLQLRRALADRTAAAERVTVAQAAVAQAEESLRIIKNRYEAGLTTVTELLRAETALLDARTRHLAAIHDQRLAAVALELNAGTLTENSEVLK